MQKGEAISLVATAASKLAAVEDVGPKRPEVTPAISSVKVSPATRATLESLKLNKTRINAVAAKTYRDVETITGNDHFLCTIDGGNYSW